MGNAVQYLKDPILVRRIQEKFGIQEIPTEDSPETIRSTCEDNSGLIQNQDKIDTSLSRDQKALKKSVNSGGGSLSWLKPKSKIRRRIPTPPLQSQTPSSDSPEPSEEGDVTPTKVLVVETSPFLDVYFRLATELGYEPFFITFLPLVMWNVDTLVARHVILMWCFSMYIGQGAKQLFRIKRPASPPVVRLEHSLSVETEYGFPSTHATVGTTIPFCLLYSIMGRYEVPFLPLFLLAIVWCLSVIFSRLYLGVHSVLDVVIGSLISVVIFPIGIILIKLIEDYAFEYPTAPIGIILTTIFLLYIYPADSSEWRKDRGDTGGILGSTMGVVLGHAALGRTPDDIDMGPFLFVVPSVQVLSLCAVRFVVGLLLVLPARFVMKLLCFKLLPRIMPTHGIEDVVRRPLVELPYKIITYGGIGFIAVYVSLIVFEICNISRWDTPL